MKKIAVFMLFGQSNAVGHAMPMEEKDYINEPLKNVFGLNREPNQSYDISELKFTGYTSFGMNLAETQDNTYSVANCLARRWQDEIDAGNPNNLPDLYIIHIAIGSQGLLDMWNMEREKVMKPGPLGTVDISMYPLAFMPIIARYCEADRVYALLFPFAFTLLFSIRHLPYALALSHVYYSLKQNRTLFFLNYPQILALPSAPRK